MTLDRKTIQDYQERYDRTIAPRHFIVKRVYQRSRVERIVDAATSVYVLAGLMLIAAAHLIYHLFFFAR